MKRLDALIIKELIGPWCFGVAMFTVLIVAASFLFQASDYIVQGIPLSMVAQYMLLILPGIMVKTFAMAVLLATLLSFGRLSSDSEIVAIRAAGVSVYRIMLPVAVFSLGVAAVAFVVDEELVPSAAMRTLQLQSEIAKTLDTSSLRPTSYPIMRKGVLVGQLVARDFNIRTGTLQGATIVSYSKDGPVEWVMDATSMKFDPKAFKDGGGWTLTGGATLTKMTGEQTISLDDRAWPEEVPRLNATPDQLLTDNVKNMDVWNMGGLQREIAKEKMSREPRQTKISNYEYFYWNKIALPLAALIYGLLGAPLGIRNQRTGTATGFALSIAIIFAYVTLANMLNVYAMGGLLPPYVASFTPIVIGLVCSVVIMWRRNA